MHRIPNIVVLAFDERDVLSYHSFLRTEAAAMAIGVTIPPQSPEQTRMFLMGRAESRERVAWSLCEDDKGEALGFFTLFNIDWINRTLEAGMAIYDPARRGQGVGTTARCLALRKIFDEMNFECVYGQYVDGNFASRRMNEKLGAVVIGTRRESAYIAGTYRDMVCFAIQRDRFRALCRS
jgi:RimJ/RimL family protein N-acetyltransferase